MVTKIVKDVDNETWRRFTGYCKIKNKRVGKLLTEILEDYLKDKIK